ncbi:MAG: hypothetical protein COB20_10520 [SAR86 cluster bacterium]|uniref:XRE family transcriptional regulator n=1 Tax=SAR86 cluster bacterium TaxID=2030880 RepID=A0A2A4X1M5_9GAMM|nr:MAG: hypothetical protein COB20_10520 [SAR86 cluster bacterium]
MLETTRVLNEIADSETFGSFYKIAKFLEVTPSYMYQVKYDAKISDKNLLRIADAMEMNPMALIAMKNMDKAKDNESREFWRKIYESSDLYYRK